jgi:hypothetical protein
MGTSQSQEEILLEALEKRKQEILPNNLLPFYQPSDDKRLGQCIAGLDGKRMVMVEYFSAINALRTTIRDKSSAVTYMWNCCECKMKIHPPNTCAANRDNKGYRLVA